ncbi:MAG: Gmad2 immunoglobulin-like domain-containing protein [Candidatus Pacebacteria bacterium]|nr:Gmad2 immunoglobulin-like domain-containing protein [Candidatus Paceibacterota bacterium]
MNPEHNQSRTLLITVGSAILIVVIGAMWYMTRSSGDDFDFESATTTRSGSDTRVVAGQSQNIIVYAPRMNERVGTPVIVEGQARVFENVVNYRLVDANGNELIEGFATADAPDIGQFGVFRGELNYVSNVDQKGTVEIFWYSAKDGSEVDKVTIPVTITKTPEFIKG